MEATICHALLTNGYSMSEKMRERIIIEWWGQDGLKRAGYSQEVDNFTCASEILVELATTLKELKDRQLWRSRKISLGDD